MIFLMFCVNTLNAQNENDTSKYTHFYYKNGNISSKGLIIQGKPDGYWETYYENKILKSEGNRKNFKLDGKWKFYNEKGEIVLEVNYKNDKKNGIKRTYYDKEIIDENFTDDIKQGLTVYYYADGKIHKGINFVKGKKQGIAKEYSKQGLIITLTEYRNNFIVNKESINRFDTDRLKHGTWKIFYKNEKIKSEGIYNHGKKNGYFKKYSEDGNIVSIDKYIDDELQKDVEELTKLDVKTTYYKTGVIKTVASYKDNIPEGIRRDYSSEGKIISSKTYKQGIVVNNGIIDEQGFKQGLWEEYYETGELKSKGKYENGEKTDVWKFYYKNGTLEQQGFYNKNKKNDGIWRWYYESGNLLREEKFVNGVLNGFTKEYTDSSKIITQGEYIDGLKEGLWIYELGNHREEGKYVVGKREGLWKYYYSNGQINFEGKYIDDIPDEKHTYYWGNGNIKKQGMYIMGAKQGEWKKYNSDGLLFFTTLYKNGIEIKYDGVKIKPAFEKN